MRRVRSWLLAVGLAATGAVYATPARVDSSSRFDDVRANFRSSQATLFDRHGRVLHRLRVDERARRLDWVDADEFSAALIPALIRSEDRRFYEHGGVDWNGVASASVRNVLNQKSTGASTLTMQLAGLLDADLARGAQGRTWSQKVGQARAARDLERRWSKRQILEAYLNLAPFRGEVVGIDAAAQTFFGKRPIGLSAWESAMLVAMLRAPNASADRIARRACQLLALPDCTAYEGFTRLALARARDGSVKAFDEALSLRGSAQTAPHLAHALLRRDQASVVSTLDARVQRTALDAIARHLGALQGRQVDDAAVVVLENRSGEVLAWVGSSGQLSNAAEVDGVTALRQAGSTLKPFVYALALDDRLLTAVSLVEDLPLDINTATGQYVPQNYDRGFKGVVTVRTALASSLNVPAVRTLSLTGPQRLLDRLRRAGFSSLRQSAEHYGLSLALGGADVSLLELTNAYRMLANQGAYSPPVVLPGRTVPGVAARTVFSAPAAFIVGDVLSDRNARSLTFGLDSPLALRFWSAVKTGTSKDMRDNWCIGFSDRYTVGVWVGNFDGRPMWNVSGSSGAAPIWSELMGELHRGQPGQAPLAPAGLARRAVSFGTDPDGDGESLARIAADREEWFVAGTELSRVDRVALAEQALSIATPLAFTRFALDPDIPPAHQTILFSAGGHHAQLAQWKLNGRHVGRGARFAWSPWPGWHRLELFHAGRLIESRDFEVRGAGLRPGLQSTRLTRNAPKVSRDD